MPNFQILKDELAQINSIIYSELLKSRLLRINPTTPKIKVTPIFFAPFFSGEIHLFTEDWVGLPVIQNLGDLEILYEVDQRACCLN
jgi:hypothetical protein